MNALDSLAALILIGATIGILMVVATFVAVARDGYGRVPDRREEGRVSRWR